MQALPKKHAIPAYQSIDERPDLLTNDAAAEITLGGIPDLESICRALAETSDDAAASALDFLPALRDLELTDPDAIERFLQNEKTTHLLVKNDRLKVVLFHWKPGDRTAIHGHPLGGGVYKVLRGRLLEARYTPHDPKQLVSTSTFRPGSVAYIDDALAHHAVSNPFGESAISLHAYAIGAVRSTPIAQAA